MDLRYARAVLVTLATVRLIRLVTDDHLGQWLVQQPAERWGTRHEVDRDGGDSMTDPDYPRPATWQGKVAQGLACQYCVGFWLGTLVLLGEVVTSTRPLRWTRPVWTFALTALSLNAVAGALRNRGVLD